MQAHPFRLTPLAGLAPAKGYQPTVDLCCKPAVALAPQARRKPKLADLDPFMHCSVIGTCMSTAELRKLVPRFTDLDRQHASDVDIHHGAVQLANEGGAGCKALQKALDQRYEGAVRKFDTAKDPAALLALWHAALKSGDIPSAYWALMTHPETTEAIRQEAFGDVHMLSHLVGAANRADIRRLIDLEAENTTLKEKIESQQHRLHELGAERDAALRELSAQAAEFSARTHREALAMDTDLGTEVLALRQELAARDQLLALHTHRREAAQERALLEHETSAALRRERDDALMLIKAIQDEVGAMEQAMLASAEAQNERSGLDHLQGKRIVYVGGRPGTHTVLKKLVESANGELVVHDGGIEDRKGMFAATLPRADLVVFPVDCIDHDSMNTLKRVCERHQVAWYPLRTASAACFIELMTRTATENTAPASRFCLRHG